MEHIKPIINRVLSDFFKDMRGEIIIIDDSDTYILAEAIAEVLIKKGYINENKN